LTPEFNSRGIRPAPARLRVLDKSRRLSSLVREAIS
jgi:hypothetical protein